MNYRKNEKNGDMLSMLGFGAMRLPKVEGDKKTIDTKEAVRILRLAHELGVNYFDTAYIYDGSEVVVGEALKPIRKDVKLATKLPLRGARGRADFDRLFSTSLERLQTDYIDYYLLHNLMSYAQYERLVSYGINEWIAEKKAKGEIVNIGFSAHANLEDFKKIADAYDWDFCQIQYNYVDINFQAGEDGLKYVAAKGMPVIIMEPLRGGALVNKLPKAAENAFKAHNSNISNAEWGLKWLYNQPEVTVVLSGMGSEEMLRENARIASQSDVGCLTQEELDCYTAARKEIAEGGAIPCTGCGYCTPCPHGVAIPVCFTCYNNKGLTGGLQALGNYVVSVGGFSEKPSYAGLCVGCGACEKKCPQGIAIRDGLKKVQYSFEIPMFRTIVKIARKVIKV